MNCFDWLDEGLHENRDAVRDRSNAVVFQYLYETKITRNTSFGVQTMTHYLYRGGMLILALFNFLLFSIKCFIYHISLTFIYSHFKRLNTQSDFTCNRYMYIYWIYIMEFCSIFGFIYSAIHCSLIQFFFYYFKVKSMNP